MAATGKTPILLYGSTTATNQPSAGNLTNSSDGCEIAINVADKNLFFKDSTNTVNTVPIRQSNTSSNGWLSSTDWNTFNGKQAALVSGTNIKTVNGTTLLGSGDLGTIGTGYGGTGLTSFTANRIFYASSTSAISQSSNLTFDGTTFATSVINTGLGISTGDAAIEVGGSRTGDGVCYIDMHSTSGSDYESRIIRYSGANGAFRFINTGTAATQFYSGATQTMQIAASGGVSIGNTTDPGAGNLRFNTTGSNGIYFGSSSQLNDYEEGTYTATLTPETSGTITVNSSVNTMVYRKIGKVVTVTGLIQVSAVSSPVGSYAVLNLPYAASSSVYGGQAGGSASRIPNGSSVPTATPWIIPRNGANLNLYYTVSGTASPDQINFSITYVTD